MKDKDKLADILGEEATKDVYDWTFVDRKGEIKVKADDSFQDARPFTEGLAAVQSRGKDSKGIWGFINTEFKTAVPFCFEQVSDFRAGLAFANAIESANEKTGCEQYFQGYGIDEQQMYIDKTGKIIKPQW